MIRLTTLDYNQIKLTFLHLIKVFLDRLMNGSKIPLIKNHFEFFSLLNFLIIEKKYCHFRKSIN